MCVDIFALGCIITEIWTGVQLLPEIHNDDLRLAAVLEVFGRPSRDYVTWLEGNYPTARKLPDDEIHRSWSGRLQALDFNDQTVVRNLGKLRSIRVRGTFYSTY